MNGEKFHLNFLDSIIPFYYFTSAHQRFYEGELPNFNEPRTKPRKDRAPRRELTASNVARQTSFPVRGSLSVWAQFHNFPVSLPLLPTASTHKRVAAEHSYV